MTKKSRRVVDRDLPHCTPEYITRAIGKIVDYDNIFKVVIGSTCPGSDTGWAVLR
jgi:hypothetical protein